MPPFTKVIFKAYNGFGFWSANMGPQPVGTISTIVRAYEAINGLPCRDWDFAHQTGRLTMWFVDGRVEANLIRVGTFSMED